MKKIVLLNTSNRVGGAAIAASRLLSAIQPLSFESAMMVLSATGNQLNVFTCFSNNSYKAKWHRVKNLVNYYFTEKWVKKEGQPTTFSLANFGAKPQNHALIKNADLLHFHWINHGFVSLTDLKELISLKKPIIWHLHDMWPFTGGCHYAANCIGFTKQCGNCPMLRFSNKNDISALIFAEKLKIFAEAPITWVGASQWIANEARKSPLTTGHNVVHIPNPIDTSIFFPTEKIEAKKKWHLPFDQPILLFASANTTDPRKGFDYLAKALANLINSHPDFNPVVLLIGKTNQNFEKFPVKVFQTGYLNNELDLATAYNASDLFIIPSLEDNLPNTIVEAMSCGLPAVGFATGGIPELIIDHKTGFTVSLGDTIGLSEAIVKAYLNRELFGKECRKFIEENLAEKVVSVKYNDLYNKLLG